MLSLKKRQNIKNHKKFKNEDLILSNNRQSKQFLFSKLIFMLVMSIILFSLKSFILIFSCKLSNFNGLEDIDKTVLLYFSEYKILISEEQF